MAVPDFLIIGAMKCGTSTLQAQLARQPGIFMSSPKEPNFFSDDDVYARGTDWYERLFAAARTGDLKGEASTHYTKLPTHPQTLSRLRMVLHSPRIVYLVRNPIDRAVSHYVHEWTMGNVTTSLDVAIDSCPEFVEYGRYGYQVSPYVEAFGADAIFVASLEEMIREPQALLNRLGNFLGRSGFVWREDEARVNASAERVRRMPFHEVLIDSPVATLLRRTLVPRSVRDRIRRGRQMRGRPTLSPDRQRQLEQIFAADYSQLRSILPACPGIAASYPFVQQ